jgi:hypothetical protein
VLRAIIDELIALILCYDYIPFLLPETHSYFFSVSLGFAKFLLHKMQLKSREIRCYKLQHKSRYDVL